MITRRRLALWLDPSLTPTEPLPPITTSPFLGHGQLSAIAHDTERIARALESMDRRRRRPRNVWCQHPELHPEIER